MTKQLKVGDVVYYDSLGLNKYIIDRVTKTMAMSGLTKFKIDYDNIVQMVGGGWNSYCQIETPEIKEKYEKYILINKITKINWKEMSLDTLHQVWVLAKK